MLRTTPSHKPSFSVWRQRNHLLAGIAGCFWPLTLVSGAMLAPGSVAQGAPVCSAPNVVVAVGETCPTTVTINSGTNNTVTVNGTLDAGINFLNTSTGVSSVNIGATGVISGDTVFSFAAIGTDGTITTLTNAGTIGMMSGDLPVSGIANFGTITTVNNSGLMHGSGYLPALYNTATINTFNNSGTLDAQYDAGVFNLSSGLITTFNNTKTGVITGNFGGFYNDGQIGTLTNSGKITAGNDAAGSPIGNRSGATIDTLNNSGSIISTNGVALVNQGPNSTLAAGIINTLNNTGTIQGATNGIENRGTIGTLNNAQSKLTYVGNLPSFYNVIVTSTGYGSIVLTSPTTSATGPMVVGISSLSTSARASNMTDVISGVSASQLANVGQTVSYSLNNYSYHYLLKDIDGNGTFDLQFVNRTPWEPNADNTAAAMLTNANALRNVMAYNLTSLAFMTGYDCAAFDKNGVCISFQARYSGTNALNSGAGVLTAAYRIAEQFRVGAFIDYGATGGTPSSINLDNQLPAFGAFVGYSQKPDGTGVQGKLIGVFQNGNVTVGRGNGLPDTEAGSGKSSLNSYAIAGELGWGYAINPTMIATPFVGIRYSNSTRGAYTEWGSSTVLYPISFNSFSEWMTTAAVGVRLNGMLSDKVGYQIGAGIEYDLSQNISQYSGSSTIPGLTTFAFNTDGADNRFRGFGQIGMFYQVTNNQRVVGNVAVRNQAFSAPAAVSAMAGYQVSF